MFIFEERRDLSDFPPDETGAMVRLLLAVALLGISPELYNRGGRRPGACGAGQ